MANYKKELYSKLKDHLRNDDFLKFDTTLTEYCTPLIDQLIDSRFDKRLTDLLDSPEVYPEKDDIFLNIAETLAFLKIKRTTLYNRTKDPHFPKPKENGRRILYSKKSLIDYLNRIKGYNRKPP